MKTVDELIADWDRGRAAATQANPNCAAAKQVLDRRAVAAARRIWEKLTDPTQPRYFDLAGVDYNHPSRWSERTLLMLAGCIEAEMGQVKDAQIPTKVLEQLYQWLNDGPLHDWDRRCHFHQLVGDLLGKARVNYGE